MRKAPARDGKGTTLSPEVRRAVEPHVRVDLGSVRVHGGQAAQRSAATLGARAFTYGRDVFLGRGERPNDLRLMAHELAHVEQQTLSGRPAIRRKAVSGTADSPEEQRAEAVAEDVIDRTAPAHGLLVDDGSAATDSQMARSLFMRTLYEAVSATAQDILGPLWSRAGCPFINRWFSRHASDDAATLERLAQSYSGMKSARSASDYIPAICSRLRDGIVRWSAGADVSREVNAADGLDAGMAAVQAKSASEAPVRSPTNPGRFVAELGAGQRLEASSAARFGNALGADFRDVRLHTDAAAGQKADAMGALAFTVGRHIGFSAGAYRPGTLRGDALLAHELAHVAQQRAALGRSTASPAPEAADGHLERDADRAALGTVARLHSPLQSLESRPELETGLRLQRCDLFKKDQGPPPGGDPAPPTRSGSKDLPKGTMTWRLSSAGTSSAEQQISFTPNSSVGGRTVTFVQTVLAMRGGNRMYAENDSASRRYEAGSDHRRVDMFLRENDPFYGAIWNGTRWVAEESQADRQAGRRNNPSSATDPARLYDRPALNLRQDESQVFETAAIVPETREVLGTLRWGLAYHSHAPYRELLYGTPDDCNATASTDFYAALDQFYVARYETILDGFAPGSAELSDEQRAQLASTITRLTGNSRLQVECGGAADLHEADPVSVANHRARAVRDYLVSRGISESRIQVVGYGAAWARVATHPGADEPRNRRVQIWIHEPGS